MAVSGSLGQGANGEEAVLMSYHNGSSSVRNRWVRTRSGLACCVWCGYQAPGAYRTDFVVWLNLIWSRERMWEKHQQVFPTGVLSFQGSKQGLKQLNLVSSLEAQLLKLTREDAIPCLFLQPNTEWIWNVVSKVGSQSIHYHKVMALGLKPEHHWDMKDH